MYDGHNGDRAAHRTMLNMECHLMRAFHKGKNVLAGMVRTFCLLLVSFVLAQLYLNLVCPCPFAFESSASKKSILCMVMILLQMYAL